MRLELIGQGVAVWLGLQQLHVNKFQDVYCLKKEDENNKIQFLMIALEINAIRTPHLANQTNYIFQT